MENQCLQQLEFSANSVAEANKIAEAQRKYYEEFLPEEQRRPVHEIRIFLLKELGKFFVFMLIGPAPYIAS